jgi:hypothetical protein
VQTAKKAETRARRIAELVAMLARGESCVPRGIIGTPQSAKSREVPFTPSGLVALSDEHHAVAGRFNATARKSSANSPNAKLAARVLQRPRGCAPTSSTFGCAGQLATCEQ